MRQSKWNPKKIGHYRPIKDCKTKEGTFNEICLECNHCGRFKPIDKKKKHLRKLYGIDWRVVNSHNKLLTKKWRHWKIYRTASQRKEALNVLQSKRYYGLKCFEFRQCKCKNKNKDKK